MFAYLGALAQGVTGLERGQLRFDCGCTHDGKVAGYALVTCPQNHFNQYCDRRKLAEHRATHKRRRKDCRYCAGVVLACALAFVVCFVSTASAQVQLPTLDQQTQQWQQRQDFEDSQRRQTQELENEMRYEHQQQDWGAEYRERELQRRRELDD